jgi:hypothetical protein
MRVLRPRRDERGQVIVMFALLLVPLMAAAALTIDISTHVNERQDVRTAVDAGALAAAAQLPATAANAAAITATARGYTTSNDTELTNAAVAVGFQCYADDSNGDNLPDASFVPSVCHVNGSHGGFDCAGGRCFARPACFPAQGDVCNVVTVGSGKDVDYGFGQVVGIDKGNTGTITSAACRGGCGGAPASPMDVVVILDRTGSMSDPDLNRVKDATRSLLTFLDPTLHRVAIGLLGPSNPNDNTCNPSRARGKSSSAGNATWIVAPYSNGVVASEMDDYRNPGSSTLNNSSALVGLLAGNAPAGCINHSSVGTNLGQPIAEAMSRVFTPLTPSGRDKGIIFLTDGAGNQPNTQSCKFGDTNATTAKNAGIQIVTIGFGVADEQCSDAERAGSSTSTYRTSGSLPRNGAVTQLLADMASPINGVDADDNFGCTAAENSDNDNFFCQPFGTDLTSVFIRAAGQLTGKPRLIQLP